MATKAKRGSKVRPEPVKAPESPPDGSTGILVDARMSAELRDSHLGQFIPKPGNSGLPYTFICRRCGQEVNQVDAPDLNDPLWCLPCFKAEPERVPSIGYGSALQVEAEMASETVVSFTCGRCGGLAVDYERFRDARLCAQCFTRAGEPDEGPGIAVRTEVALEPAPEPEAPRNGATEPLEAFPEMYCEACGLTTDNDASLCQECIEDGELDITTP